MNIYIDESGSFISPPTIGAWNVVAAYIAPESCKRELKLVLNKLKIRANHPINEEIKLHKLGEANLIYFLERLNILNGSLFCTATDSGKNPNETIEWHQKSQAAAIRINIEKMKYEEGKASVENLAKRIEQLSTQLYVQLMCQVNLLHKIISRAVTFYSQRIPGTLGNFRWRIDQKNSRKPEFEEVFEQITPPLLQSKTLSDPTLFIIGFDYSKLKKYEFPHGELPSYLIQLHGKKIDGFDVQKLVREDIQFVDSKENPGVQIVDLLASTTRRCLRGGFKDNDKISALLGGLMIQGKHPDPPIELICFNADSRADSKAERAVVIMKNHCKQMLK